MTDLIRKIDPAALSPEWLAVARHTDFPRAAERLAANMLDLCAEDERLCGVFKDAGHYLAAMFAAYLHGSGGLTLPLLKQICAGTGFLSPGRARAILEYLLHIDYLQPPADSAAGHYMPTERFLAAWRRHLQAALDAAAPIEPDLAMLSARLDDPRIFADYLAIQAMRLHALARGVDPFPGFRRAFLHPYAGSQILWVLTRAAQNLPPEGGIVKLSLSDMATRFGVTHLHVRRLLKRAQEEGLLAYHGHGRIAFAPGPLELIRYYYAFQLSELIESARQMGFGDALVA